MASSIFTSPVECKVKRALQKRGADPLQLEDRGEEGRRKVFIWRGWGGILTIDFWTGKKKAQ